MTATTSLCAIACALGLGGATAFAKAEDVSSQGLDEYPVSFTETFLFNADKGAVTDYAVGKNADGGNSYAFLQGKVVYTYDGERLKDYTANVQEFIEHVYYYADGENSGFYYSTRENKVYSVDDIELDATEKEELPDFTDDTEKNLFIANGYTYTLADDLLSINKAFEDEVVLEGYKNLKKYGDTAYALKDNVLYSFNGSTPNAVQITYLNFDKAKEINVGDAIKALKTCDKEPAIVKFNAGDYYVTEINLKALKDGDTYFTLGASETMTYGKSFTAKTALLLCNTGKDGKIAIVAINGKTYMLNADNLTTVKMPLADKTGTVTAIESFIYASPFDSDATVITEIDSGAKLNILKEIKKADNPEIKYDFYLVEYGEDENKVTGYIPSGYVLNYTFNEAPPAESSDPDETYDDLVKPVVLVLIVLLLVFIAVGYLIYMGTSDKKKIKKEPKENTTEDDGKKE
ncbi:MAG: hypothetical protein HDQ88_02155 [Clostridia bacterium]|nr:hypothetical protein [Clostridia bacterium]